MNYEEFIEFYNYLSVYVTRRVGRFGSNILKLAENKDLVNRIIKELNAANIPTKQYLVGCFVKHNWGHRPDLKRVLTRPYRIFYFEHIEDIWAWWTNIRREYLSEVVTPVPKGKEILKQRYAALNRPDLCMLAIAVTGGYNSKSVICRMCEKRIDCCGAISIRRGVSKKDN